MIVDPNKHYYVEPVEIEVYLKKAGKVRTVIKDLYVELVPVEPSGEKSKEIFDTFIEKDEPIDLMEVQNFYPEFIKIIYDSYYQNMDLFEKLSMHFKSGLAGSADSWRMCLYFTELLLKYEPTVASKAIGDFQTHNLNYLIVKLNAIGEPYLLEDSTVAYLIKRKNMATKHLPRDKEFDKLVELWEYNIKEKFY
ncbi:MAG TPA: hypothetical protein PK307_11795 [Spirochaetota bacterium]|nr:hypothetical protein [Spirochaetota bacterium]HOD16493.1 hypothetical protein [Spirochaetota bacterium]HPG49348.1 hypothetical protein [Spirochaetota bacterium]HPN11388.1 hypothetical protein [Spirochaetota bacterium]HQL82881.1 hypothetical protein [Spirochaetota bacterium]